MRARAWGRHERAVCMQELERKLAESEEVCGALRAELSAFDPDFWEEIEDLKYERQQLADKVAQYERIAQDVRGVTGQ